MYGEIYPNERYFGETGFAIKCVAAVVFTIFHTNLSTVIFLLQGISYTDVDNVIAALPDCDVDVQDIMHIATQKYEIYRAVRDDFKPKAVLLHISPAKISVSLLSAQST